MAVAFRSVSNTGWVTDGVGDTITSVTHPAGLTAGDVMIGIHGSASTAQSDITTDPTGWTNIAALGPEAGTKFRVFYKVATASDVSAGSTDFPHTNDGTSQEMIGVIMAFSGSAVDFVSDTGTDTAASATYSGGVTPPQANNMLVFIATSGSNVTASGYAIVTSDPTWTERADSGTSNSNAGALAIATATRAAATATGDFSITWSGANNSSGVLVSFGPTVNAAVTLDLATLTGSPQEPTIAGDANVTLDLATLTGTPNALTDTETNGTWSNKSKSSAPTWSNKSKS